MNVISYLADEEPKLVESVAGSWLVMVLGGQGGEIHCILTMITGWPSRTDRSTIRVVFI